MYHHPLAATGIALGATLFWYPMAIFALLCLGVALWRMARTFTTTDSHSPPSTSDKRPADERT